MKKIGIVTATRAEYGLLKRIMECIQNDSELELQIYATGSHLSDKYGYTIQEIEKDGFNITEKIDIMHKADYLKKSKEAAVITIMSEALSQFGEVFQKHKPDILVVLGDRYELLPICSAALIYNIPIAHLNGGEITEGAIDDVVRHCITKMSYLHFAACNQYKNRIIQLGEEPERVFSIGDTGVENVEKFSPLSKDIMKERFGLAFNKPCASVTFHPVTREECGNASIQIRELLEAICERTDIEFVVTMANADAGGNEINELLKEYAFNYSNIHLFSSLGTEGYLSLLFYSIMVIGNSSSGIIEAPSVGIPTVNIGDRQKGRLRAPSVIDCISVKEEISKAIRYAESVYMQELAKKKENPYSGGDCAKNIVSTIKAVLYEQEINSKKRFYELPNF